MRLSGIAKRMLLVVCIALPLLIAGGFAYYRSFLALPFACGALLGTALNAAKVVLLDRTAKKTAAMEDAARAGNYVRVQSLLRFLLTGLVLAVPAAAIRWGLPAGVFWGAAAGALAYQIAVYSLKLPTKKREVT